MLHTIKSFESCTSFLMGLCEHIYVHQYEHWMMERQLLSKMLTVFSENKGWQAWQTWKTSWEWTRTGPPSWRPQSSPWRCQRGPPSPSTRFLRRWHRSLPAQLLRLEGLQNIQQGRGVLCRTNLKATQWMCNVVSPRSDCQIQVKFSDTRPPSIWHPSST